MHDILPSATNTTIDHTLIEQETAMREKLMQAESTVVSLRRDANTSSDLIQSFSHAQMEKSGKQLGIDWGLDLVFRETSKALKLVAALNKAVHKEMEDSVEKDRRTSESLISARKQMLNIVSDTSL